MVDVGVRIDETEYAGCRAGCVKKNVFSDNEATDRPAAYHLSILHLVFLMMSLQVTRNVADTYIWKES